MVVVDVEDRDSTSWATFGLEMSGGDSGRIEVTVPSAQLIRCMMSRWTAAIQESGPMALPTKETRSPGPTCHNANAAAGVSVRKAASASSATLVDASAAIQVSVRRTGVQLILSEQGRQIQARTCSHGGRQVERIATCGPGGWWAVNQATRSTQDVSLYLSAQLQSLSTSYRAKQVRVGGLYEETFPGERRPKGTARFCAQSARRLVQLTGEDGSR